MKPARSLRRRMALACTGFALAAALCFSLFSLLFVYSVEDSFFDEMLAREAAHQLRAADGAASPLLPFVTVHRDSSTFPADLARDVRRGEFRGRDGRHYHVRTVPLASGNEVHLVAEVSGQLVVRPKLPFLLTFLGVATLAVLLVTAGVGYWLVQRATAPLLHLTQLMSGAAPGQLPRGFSSAFADDEIGALARRLDDAMSRIAGFIERERHFTRDASHELRTPLTVIDGAAQLLAQQDLAPQARDQLQRIRQASGHMAQCVDTLLALAREELDTSQQVQVPLLPLVERAVVDHAHLLAGKPVAVTVEVAPDACLQTHPSALAILLANLVSNAFAHTAAGRVSIRFSGGELVVADTGPGIGAELRERMHEAGVKGPDSSGHGLGLSIASRLAARGALALALDNAPGGGTEARLRPLA